MRALSVIVLILSLSFPAAILAQDGASSWKRSDVEHLLPLQLFHSSHAANLPTAEVMQQGNLEFEISHRFVPTIADGAKTLWGFDGPANIRLALGYAYSDEGYITLIRSNVFDNLDLNIKHQLFAYRNDLLPLLLAVRAGTAWNSEVPDRASAGNRRTFLQDHPHQQRSSESDTGSGRCRGFVQRRRLAHRLQHHTPACLLTISGTRIAISPNQLLEIGKAAPSDRNQRTLFCLHSNRRYI